MVFHGVGITPGLVADQAELVQRRRLLEGFTARVDAYRNLLIEPAA